jgi:predicted membrane-bound spermidine synthase
MKKKLLFLSVIEGAAVMAAELCGAKLLAPVFGSSLYVWASVMGITLAALAIGYFFGGYLSQKEKKRENFLFIILTVAALFILAMPPISFYLLPRISYLAFAPGVVFATTLLLFFPVFFLGASSPLFIALQTELKDRAGQVSGTVYAVSTAGGIFSTFLCGFYWIPEFGLNACLLFFGGLLFISNFLIFKVFKFDAFILFAALFYLNLQFNFDKNNCLLFSDSILGHLEVKDLNQENGAYRILSINAIVQSEMDLSTKRSLSNYIHVLDSLIPFTTTPKEALVLGLGAGLSSNLLVRKNYKTSGIEFDERIIDAAKNYFYLDKRLETTCADARYFLNSCRKKYDLVLVDVFKAEEQPSHVLTKESLEHLKNNLNDSARLYINWHGYLHSDIGLGTRILYQTLLSSGFQVKICSDSQNEAGRNLIFVAALHPLKKLPFQLHEAIENTLLVNTDNLPLMEKYNALANKNWRLNYLRYYQNLN